MKSIFIALLSIYILASCGTTNNLQDTTKATRVVGQASDHTVKEVSIEHLTSSFLESGSDSQHNHVVVEITGLVVAYALTEGGVYTVTLRQDNKDALCTFSPSVSDQIGGGRKISAGAELRLRGQCQSSGLFANHPFTLHGCKIIEN